MKQSQAWKTLGNKQSRQEYDKTYYEDNKERILERRKTHHKENKEAINEARRKRSKKNYTDRQPVIDALKLEVGCLCCGYSKKARLLHYHHRDPLTKNFNISDGLQNRSWVTIINEIALCDILCVSCHNKLEAKWRKKMKQSQA